MPGEVTLRVNETPTIFNKEMAIGFLLFNVVGALIGGFIGKERMASEAQEGRRLDAPSFWNKDAALGGLLGVHLGVVVAFIAASLATPVFATAIASIAVAGAGVIGLAIGGSWGKRREEREYALVIERQGERHNDPTQSVVPGILREVQSENAPSRHFAAQVEAERLRSASRENGIT